MTFKGKQVLDIRPDYRTAQSLSWMDNTTVERTGFGVETIWKLEPYARRKGTIVYGLSGLEEIEAFEDFIGDLNGKLRAFWIPTWTCDLRPAPGAVYQAGDTHLEVLATGMIQAFADHPGYQYIAVVSENSIECCKVTSVTPGGGNAERLILETPLATTPHADTTIICWLLYCRLADDDVVMDYETDDVAICKLKIVELPAELADAGLEGLPIYLYKIVSGIQTICLTSFYQEVTEGTDVYTPADINHGTVNRNASFVDDGLAIELNTTDPTNFFRQWLQASPPFATTVTVRTMFITTPEWPDPGSYTIEHVYEGDVLSVTAEKAGRLQITLSSLFRLGSTQIPRITIGRQCSWTLFSTTCGLSKSAYATAGSGTWDPSDNSIASATIPTMRPDFFPGGSLTIGESGGLVYERTISNQIGNKIFLTAPLPLAAGTYAFTAWPGCDNIWTTCAKFNNSARFGGCPYWPKLNPQLAVLTLSTGQQGTKKG